jgi:hypothetical protein
MSSTTLSEPSSVLSTPITEPVLTSQDFKFLRRLNPLLFGYIQRAMEFRDEYPEECLTNIRKFAEYVVVYVGSVTGNGTASSEGGNEDEKFSKRANDVRGYMPPEIHRALKDIWFECSEWGPHPPKEYPLTKARFRDHKKDLRAIVIPEFKKALQVAEWLQTHCGKEQSRWARIVSVFYPLSIGLKERLPKID